jgi:hypothetical protein
VINVLLLCVGYFFSGGAFISPLPSLLALPLTRSFDQLTQMIKH